MSDNLPVSYTKQALYILSQGKRLRMQKVRTQMIKKVVLSLRNNPKTLPETIKNAHFKVGTLIRTTGQNVNTRISYYQFRTCGLFLSVCLYHAST